VLQKEFDVKVDIDTETCEGCMYGKAHRLKFASQQHKVSSFTQMFVDRLKPRQAKVIITLCCSKTITRDIVMCYF